MIKMNNKKMRTHTKYDLVKYQSTVRYTNNVCVFNHIPKEHSNELGQYFIYIEHIQSIRVFNNYIW